MKGKRLLIALGSVNDKFIEEMYEPHAEEKKTIGHYSSRRLWLIAAIMTIEIHLDISGIRSRPSLR